MKKILIFALVIYCYTNILNAQDFEPSSLTFTYYANSSTYTEPFDLDKFSQTDFMLGWQWGGHPRMSEALKMKSQNIMKENVHLAKENVQLAKENVQLAEKNVHLAEENVHLAEENVHLAKENVHLEAQPHVFLL